MKTKVEKLIVLGVMVSWSVAFLPLLLGGSAAETTKAEPTLQDDIRKATYVAVDSETWKLQGFPEWEGPGSDEQRKVITLCRKNGKVFATYYVRWEDFDEDYLAEMGFKELRGVGKGTGSFWEKLN